MADRVNSLLADLKRLKVETSSLACMGCGREHNCGVHGCAVLREAADVLQEYVDLSKRYADGIMALRERPRWIPVTERLPAEGERVLAAVEGVCDASAVSGDVRAGGEGERGMTVCEAMAKIKQINDLCDLRVKGDLREGNIDMMVDLLEEYRQVLLERKVVG